MKSDWYIKGYHLGNIFALAQVKQPSEISIDIQFNQSTLTYKYFNTKPDEDPSLWLLPPPNPPTPTSPSLIQFHLGSRRYGGGDEEGQRGEEIKEGKAVRKESQVHCGLSIK